MDNRKRRSGGFTLIELMIVVAIVALLAAIAFPAYNGQVTRSHRSDAKIALQNIAQRLERCLTVYGSYTHASCAVHTDVDTGGADSADYGGEGFYTVAEANAGDIAASSFVLTATAKAGGPQAGDGECDEITLTNTGVKGAVDDSNNDTSGVCW